MIVFRTASFQATARGAGPNSGYTVVRWYIYHRVEQALTYNTIQPTK